MGIYRDLWEFTGIYESHHLKSEQRIRIYTELSTKNGDLRVECVMQMRSGRGYVDSKPQDGKLCKSGIASRAFKIWWWLDQLVCWDEQCQNLLEMESLKMEVSKNVGSPKPRGSILKLFNFGWKMGYPAFCLLTPVMYYNNHQEISDCMFLLIFRSPLIHQSETHCLEISIKLGFGFIFIQLSTMVGTPPWSTQFWW